MGDLGGRNPKAGVLCVLRRAGAFLAVLTCLTRAAPAPAAEYAEGARAFEQGDFARAISLWRDAAWVNDDIDAQIQLADLYFPPRSATAGKGASAKSRVLQYVPRDVVEGYVWTYLALTNKQRSQGSLTVLTQELSTRLSNRFKSDMPRLYNQMTSTQRRDAEQRIIYVLASRGADGFYRLGEIYFACPLVMNWSPATNEVPATADNVLCRYPNDAGARFPSASVFEEDPIDALAYFTIAEELGHKYAAAAKRRVEQFVNGKSCPPQSGNPPASSTASYEHYCDEIKRAADWMAELWEPPFEVYPNPYSDESRVDTLKQAALARVGKMECASFQEALRELGFYRGAVDNACGSMTRKATLAYQASIGGPVTGELAPAQAVKLIRTAAVNGFAPTQFTLGFMYHYGYGVPVSYPRARTWFERAANQRHPYALYNLGIMYRDGLGVSVDFGQAATYFMAAREAGYPNKHEIACRLQEVNWSDESSAKSAATCTKQASQSVAPRAKPTSAGQ